MCNPKLTLRPYDRLKSDELISFAQEIENDSKNRKSRCWPPFLVLGNRFVALSNDVVQSRKANLQNGFDQNRVEAAFEKARKEIQTEVVDYAKGISAQAQKDRTCVKYCHWVYLKSQFYSLDTIVQKLGDLADQRINFDDRLHRQYYDADRKIRAIPTPKLIETGEHLMNRLSETSKGCFRAIADAFTGCRRRTKEGVSLLTGRCASEWDGFKENLDDFLKCSFRTIKSIPAYRTRRNLKWAAGALSPFALVSLLRNTPLTQDQWAEFFSPGIEFVKEANEPFLYGQSLLAVLSASILAGAVLTLACCKKTT